MQVTPTSGMHPRHILKGTIDGWLSCVRCGERWLVMTEETNAQINQLQTQQGLFTQALKAMLEGRWVGENSVEAYLYALDPSMVDTIDYDIPVTESGESNP